MRALVCLPLLALGACATTDANFPSLQPRPAELLDPRVEVVRPLNDRPVTASLAARLSDLVAQARAGDAAFDQAAANAERLAAAAGSPESEGWVAAQEAVSAAIGARAPVTQALGDVDAIAAAALQRQGGIAPNDLAAIQSAAAEVAAIDQREADRISGPQRRLGL